MRASSERGVAACAHILVNRYDHFMNFLVTLTSAEPSLERDLLRKIRTFVINFIFPHEIKDFQNIQGLLRSIL